MLEKLSNGLKLVIEKDGRTVFRSGDSGVKPIIDSIALHREEMNGATAIDSIVGLAAAKLFAYAGIKAVHGKTMSKGAYSFLKEKGITAFFEELVEEIMNKDKTDLCPFEKMSKEADGEELCKKIKQKIYKKNK